MAITINGSTNTLTGVAVGGLPDGIVDTDMLAANAVTVGKAIGSTKGITEVDQWYVTTNQTVDTDPVTAFARVSSTGSASPLGTGMSVSSGIFTFPSTVKYLIFVKAKFNINDHDSVNFNIFVTTNNSSYSFVATCADGLNGSGQARDGGDATMYFLDVTDTSQVKVKFGVGALSTGSKLVGGSDFVSGAVFIRLGDT